MLNFVTKIESSIHNVMAIMIMCVFYDHSMLNFFTLFHWDRYYHVTSTRMIISVNDNLSSLMNFFRSRKYYTYIGETRKLYHFSIPRWLFINQAEFIASWLGILQSMTHKCKFQLRCFTIMCVLNHLPTGSWMDWYVRCWKKSSSNR